MRTAQKLIAKIGQLDSKGARSGFRSAIERTVNKAVSEDKPLDFVVFTCSTIDPKRLFSPKPWLYVSTDPAGNNLTPDVLRLQQAIKELKKIYPKTQLTVIIGNTDPYYIYLCQFRDFPKKKDVLWKKFASRWRRYKNEFTDWLGAEASDMGANIVSWYRFEKDIEDKDGKSFEAEYQAVLKDIGVFFNKRQLDWEFRKLRTQFARGAYFDGLKKPVDALLKDWVRRKFAEYAVQGKWIYESMPGSILIQNEKPSSLRSAMYQPVIKARYGNMLPVVYFLGIDDAGYQ